MNKKSNAIFGGILVLIGVLIAVSSIFKIIHIVFFKGWLGILILGFALYDMYKKGRNKDNTTTAIVGIAVFVVLRTNLIRFIFSKLLVPIILLAIGIHMITKKTA